MTYSILRLKGPLMSFGGPKVSAKKEPSGRWPRLSMITGLLGNALGLDRTDTERLQNLQQSISYAVREDVRPDKIVDYQTADLGSDVLHHKKNAWTTHGRIEERAGGSSEDTDQRYREYLSGGAYTVSLRSSLLSSKEIREAVLYPVRPLFIGRKSCLPSVPLHIGTVDATSALAALRDLSTFEGDPPDACLAWHEDDRGEQVFDQRDWTQQTHAGSRQIRKTTLFF